MSSKEPIGINLSDNSYDAMRQALQYEFDNSGKTAEEVLKWGAYYYTRSARKATKSARKNAKKKLVRLDKVISGKKRRRKKDAQWGAVKLYQNRKPRVIKIWGSAGKTKTEVKKFDIVKVNNIGAAKNSWWGALRDVKKAIARSGNRNVNAGTRKKVRGKEYSLTVWNRLTYILKKTPNIESVGLANAAKGIALRTERKIGKGWK